MEIKQKAKAALLFTLVASWAYALFLSQRQAELCERKAGSERNACSVEWQLAITTALGVAQTVLGIFFPSEDSPKPLTGLDPFARQPGRSREDD